MKTITDSSSSTTFGFRNRNWLDLPVDIRSKILSKLSAIDIIMIAQTCSSWRRICKDPSMWRRIEMRNSGERYNNMMYLENMCRLAVNRSDGELTEIIIYFFCTDELLQYIVKRSSGLKSLRLVSCFDITDKGLINAAAKLPLLEELELTYCRISNKPLKAFGKSCPLLKSLKFNSRRPLYPSVYDGEALVIAENMPGLRHLQLYRNEMTDSGLQAILSGCPQLESLDLRKCKNLNFKGDLKKICIDQVKLLKLPDASRDDYPYVSQYFSYEYCHDEDEYHDLCGSFCNGRDDDDDDDDEEEEEEEEEITSNGSSNLKHLRLGSKYYMSDEELIKTVEKLPLLEELEIKNLSYSKEALIAVGKSCPLLNSFKFNKLGFRHKYKPCDDEALAIAENMPGLRHLELVGNNLTDIGLRAILSGCPHLESLDIRKCYHLSIRSNLENFHADHVKSLKLPFLDW